MKGIKLLVVLKCANDQMWDIRSKTLTAIRPARPIYPSFPPFTKVVGTRKPQVLSIRSSLIRSFVGPFDRSLALSAPRPVGLSGTFLCPPLPLKIHHCISLSPSLSLSSPS